MDEDGHRTVSATYQLDGESLCHQMVIVEDDDDVKLKLCTTKNSECSQDSIWLNLGMYNVVKEHEKDKLSVKEGRTQRERYCTRETDNCGRIL